MRDFKQVPEDSIENKENDPYYQFQRYKEYKQKQEEERRNQHKRLASSVSAASYASSGNDVKGDRQSLINNIPQGTGEVLIGKLDRDNIIEMTERSNSDSKNHPSQENSIEDMRDSPAKGKQNTSQTN